MQQLRYALRHLIKHAGFSLIVALTLGVGIGLVATQFSMIDALLLRPLPFAPGDRLQHISIDNHNNGPGWRPLPLDTYRALRDQQSSFDALAVFSFDYFNLSQTGAAPRRLVGRAVSANFFSVLQVQPSLGRSFQAGEDQAGQPLRVVLAHRVWQDEFGADPAIIGRSVRLNGEAAEVIGITPRGFGFPTDEECWVNLRIAATADSELSVEVMGVLKAGVSAVAAASDVQTIVQRLPRKNSADAETHDRILVQRFPIAYNGGGTATLLGIMLAMTLFVLALACVNVANLLFVRGSDRMRELAVRSALGAERAQLVRQLVLESLLLSALGGVVGALCAAIGVLWLDAEITARMTVASWMHFTLDARVLRFTILTALISGVAAGLLPALRLSQVNLNDALRAAGRGNVSGSRAWMRGSIVVGQLGFACAALVVASLLALSALRSGQRTLAFDPGSLVVGRIELQGLNYVEAEQRARFYNQLIERLQQVPGVAAAAVSSRDLVSPGVYSAIVIEGRAPARAMDQAGGWLEVVSRDYFSVVKLQALSGRLFSSSDTGTTQPVALINQSFADRYWPGANPIGQRLRRSEPDALWATVIGVVPDLNLEGISNIGSSAGFYLLQDQQAWGWLDMLVRVQTDPAAMLAPLRAAVTAIDPDQPVHMIGTLSARTRNGLAGPQIVGNMASLFALAALLLVAVGIYGVTAFAARKRTRELGLRMALGAQAASVAGLLVRQNLAQTLCGIGLGLILGYTVANPLGAVLPGVSVNAPGIYLGVAAVLSIAALLASWLPARRASKQDPLVSLRAD